MELELRTISDSGLESSIFVYTIPYGAERVSISFPEVGPPLVNSMVASRSIFVPGREMDEATPDRVKTL